MKSLNALFLLPLFLFGCDFDEVPNFVPEEGSTNYRQEMRDLVQDISRYAKGIDSDFIVIPQNGVELVTVNGRESGAPDTAYLNAIDGIGQKPLFYNNDQPTTTAERQRLRAFLDIAKDRGKVVLVTDFASSQNNVDDSYDRNEEAGYISFAADHRELDNIPGYPSPIHDENSRTVLRLSETENFLYLINTRLFSTRQDLVDAISDSNYDLVIMDFFFDGEEYTAEQIQQLREKRNGGTRLLISYMSIGWAEDFRFYWQNHWPTNPPPWLKEQITGNPGHYRVQYWRDDWQDILFGNNDSYLFKIIDAGFDGVYLDRIDAFEFFEEQDDQ